MAEMAEIWCRKPSIFIILVVLQSSLQELAFFLSKVVTSTFSFLFALIDSRISLQNPQNGAVRTRPKIRFFINPLERLINFQKLLLSGCPRSDAEEFRSGWIRSGGLVKPLGRFFHLFWFSRISSTPFSVRSALFSIRSLGPVYVITSCFLQ